MRSTVRSNRPAVPAIPPRYAGRAVTRVPLSGRHAADMVPRRGFCRDVLPHASGLRCDHQGAGFAGVDGGGRRSGSMAEFCIVATTGGAATAGAAMSSSVAIDDVGGGAGTVVTADMAGTRSSTWPTRQEVVEDPPVELDSLPRPATEATAAVATAPLVIHRLFVRLHCVPVSFIRLTAVWRMALPVTWDGSLEGGRWPTGLRAMMWTRSGIANADEVSVTRIPL